MSRLQLIASTAMAVLAAGFAGSAAAKTTVTMNTVQIFGTIDPAKISDYTDYMAAVNLYDGLVTVDSSGNLQPELAESWTVSPDAKEVTFKLRSDAHFSDGSPVEAADVVYSFDTAFEDQSRAGQPLRRRAEAGFGRGRRSAHR